MQPLRPRARATAEPVQLAQLRATLGPVAVRATPSHERVAAGPRGLARPRWVVPAVGLYWRVFAVNAAILMTAFLLLVLTPVSVSSSVTPGQVAVLSAGLAVMLIANAALLRLSLTPLRKLTGLMSSVDVLDPGRRLDAAGADEVVAVITAFNATLDRLEEERRVSTRRVLSAQEAERLRIAQELHDQIGQNLTAVVLELRRLRGMVSPVEADLLSDAQELARESLDELRRISYRLRPAALDDLGLSSALATLCDDITRRTGIQVTHTLDLKLPALDRDVELAIYRVAQEALTNAVRHAHCGRVEMHLTADDGGLTLHVRDDGAGLGNAPPGGGIRGMRERALMIGGSVSVRNRPRAGVEVNLRVPSTLANHE